MALVDLDRRLAGQDARIVHILHDEIIVEVREDIADDLAVVVKDCMERAFTEIFPEVPFVVTPKIRDTWGENSRIFKIIVLSDFYLANIIWSDVVKITRIASI